MEIELTVKKIFEVKTLLIDAGVRYWEDATVNGVEDEDGELIPCRFGDRWKPIIDIETGIILNWEIDITAKVHYKVCDDGEYWLMDENDYQITKAKGYYVPDFLGDMGDYIILEIDKTGLIKDWNFDIKPFTNKEEG